MPTPQVLPCSRFQGGMHRRVHILVYLPNMMMIVSRTAVSASNPITGIHLTGLNSLRAFTITVGVT